ncbi:hypothetical protein M5C99_05070 [Acidovorax sp. NCPPB 2350]|nr:hypothetical protein M5C99_05070 [Acidovorax sp. NCPPB 2350]
MKKIILAVLILVSYCSSFAQFAAVEGVYCSSTSSLQVVLLDGENGVAAASTTVSQPPCSGSVAGIGRIKSRKLEFKPYGKAAGSDLCVITAEWDDKWRGARVTDNGACNAYHGSSCSWSGQYVLKKECK